MAAMIPLTRVTGKQVPDQDPDHLDREISSRLAIEENGPRPVSPTSSHVTAT